MKSRDFCYWLQGFFEILDSYDGPQGPKVGTCLNVHQVECIKKHLHLVFKHEIDPGMGSAQHQKDLKDIHWKPFCSPQTFPSLLDDAKVNC